MLPKYQRIADVLRDQIREGHYPQGGLLPTEQALCEEFDASRQTVRQALQCLVTEGLILRRQGSGSRVCEKPREILMPPRTVAVVSTYISDYIFPGILREIEQVLSANNCTPLLFSTQNQVSNERKVLQNLLNLPKLDGILIEGTKAALPNPNLDLYRRLMARNIPMVFMHGHYPELSGGIAILDDNYNGGYALVKYLHGKGHTHIAGIFKADDQQGHQRYAGYAAALTDLDLPLEDANIYWYYTATKDLLSAPDPVWENHLGRVLSGCTAVVCYNDDVASSLIPVLQRRGVRIPEDLAVVSFDDSRYSDLTACRITTLSHGSQNVGRLAAQALMKCFQGEPCPPVQNVPWKLVEKESS